MREAMLFIMHFEQASRRDRLLCVKKKFVGLLTDVSDRAVRGLCDWLAQNASRIMMVNDIAIWPGY